MRSTIHQLKEFKVVTIGEAGCFLGRADVSGTVMHFRDDEVRGISRVTYDIYMVPRGVMRLMKGKLRSKFTEGFGHHLEEAAVYIETGEISQAKQMQLAAQ